MENSERQEQSGRSLRPRMTSKVIRMMNKDTVKFISKVLLIANRLELEGKGEGSGIWESLVDFKKAMISNLERLENNQSDSQK